MKIGLESLEYYLPKKIVSLDKLDSFRIISSKEALKNFGFNKIRIAEKETSFDLASNAIEKLLKISKISPDDVDVILYSSAIPNDPQHKYLKDPTQLFKYPAIRLQYVFGLKRATVFAISQAGCVSLMQSIRIARDMLFSEPQLRKILCVSSDVLPKNSKREILFNLISDGACAVLVSKESKRNRIVSYSQVTKGFFWDSSKNKTELIASYFPTARFVIQEALKKAHLSMSDIKIVIPHNVNKKSWDVLSQILELPRKKLFDKNIGKFGHTVAADNIINLSDATDLGLVKRGDYVLLFTFGFGAHWACLIIQH